MESTFPSAACDRCLKILKPRPGRCWTPAENGSPAYTTSQTASLITRTKFVFAFVLLILRSPGRVTVCNSQDSLVSLVLLNRTIIERTQLSYCTDNTTKGIWSPRNPTFPTPKFQRLSANSGRHNHLRSRESGRLLQRRRSCGINESSQPIVFNQNAADVESLGLPK